MIGDRAPALGDGILHRMNARPCQGIVLAATEDWQFVRVMANRRLVLSPGSWNVLGELNNVAE